MKLLNMGTPHSIAGAKQFFAAQLSFHGDKAIPLYNIACCEARLGNSKEAIHFLQNSINAGYMNVEHIEQDSDLDSIRKLEEFKNTINFLRETKDILMTDDIPSSSVPITTSNTVLGSTTSNVEVATDLLQAHVNHVTEIFTTAYSTVISMTGQSSSSLPWRTEAQAYIKQFEEKFSDIQQKLDYYSRNQLVEFENFRSLTHSALSNSNDNDISGAMRNSSMAEKSLAMHKKVCELVLAVLELQVAWNELSQLLKA